MYSRDTLYSAPTIGHAPVWATFPKPSEPWPRSQTTPDLYLLSLLSILLRLVDSSSELPSAAIFRRISDGSNLIHFKTPSHKSTDAAVH
jgi:hypothetical protein